MHQDTESNLWVIIPAVHTSIYIQYKTSYTSQNYLNYLWFTNVYHVFNTLAGTFWKEGDRKRGYNLQRRGIKSPRKLCYHIPTNFILKYFSIFHLFWQMFKINLSPWLIFQSCSVMKYCTNTTAGTYLYHKIKNISPGPIPEVKKTCIDQGLGKHSSI